MEILVLGSAAGGGFPQWNCNCRNCSGVRTGQVRAQARTQSSIAVRADGGDWLLFNASPDILSQIRAAPDWQPARQLRDSGIAAVLLMDAQIDHVTGLFMLRERGAPLPVWCTDQVAEDLQTGNPVFRVLGHFCGVDRRRIVPGEPFCVPQVPGLRLTPVALSSKAPPYSPHRDAPHPGDNIGMLIEDAQGHRVFYAPGLGTIEPQVAACFDAADCLMLDGTFWRDDEMIALGISGKSARDIGHLPQSGPGGMIDSLARWPGKRRVLIHINNTNPILDEDSPERAQLDEAGIEVAYDGMRLHFGD